MNTSNTDKTNLNCAEQVTIADNNSATKTGHLDLSMIQTIINYVTGRDQSSEKANEKLIRDLNTLHGPSRTSAVVDLKMKVTFFQTSGSFETYNELLRIFKRINLVGTGKFHFLFLVTIFEILVQFQNTKGLNQDFKKELDLLSKEIIKNIVRIYKNLSKVDLQELHNSKQAKIALDIIGKYEYKSILDELRQEFPFTELSKLARFIFETQITLYSNNLQSDSKRLMNLKLGDNAPFPNNIVFSKSPVAKPNSPALSF